jgi:hypothetical protein
VLVDFDRGELWFSRNKELPTRPAFSGFVADQLTPIAYVERRGTVTFNFSATPPKNKLGYAVP